MTTNRIERLTREALGTQVPANSDAGRTASYAAPALLIVAVTAVLLLSGCALNPEQQYQTGALNPGEATSWLDQVQSVGSASFTGP